MKKRFMKVAVYHKNDDIRIEERPVPDITDGEILVKMKASGICGTDVMEWYRIKKGPRILGHEMAGEIVKVGDRVEGFRNGDRVFVSHHVPCYSCRHCNYHNYTACETLHAGNYEPGGFAEFIRVPEVNVKHGTLHLPDRISYEEATMIEPLGCVIAGQKQIGLKEGQTVLVIGSGISGLLHIQVSKAKGAMVIATDISEYRLRKALEFGADHAVNAKEFSIDTLRRINNDFLADIVIVCAGARQAVLDAFASVERKGTLLFFAVPEGEIAFPFLRFWRDEITTTFSYGAAPHELNEALGIIDSGTINVGSMITHRLPLPEIQHGFNIVTRAKDSLKVVVISEN